VPYASDVIEELYKFKRDFLFVDLNQQGLWSRPQSCREFWGKCRPTYNGIKLDTFHVFFRNNRSVLSSVYYLYAFKISYSSFHTLPVGHDTKFWLL